MDYKQPLPDNRETQAQELAERIRDRVNDDILALARLLVSKDDPNVFGETEFPVRDLVHRMGAQAIEERVQKKTATREPESIAPDADAPPASKAIGPKPS